jgi:hypothetical protein
MKKLFTLAFLFSASLMSLLAQDKTTVTATNSEISDNLDLRAIATIFGEASDLEDFEKRINDPKAQISNLDLNDDNYVDYLRVIESIEGNDHIIVIQSVIDKDMYQDVASIEVQKGKNNKVQVQVVGDVYMYGENYIYEPVYVHTPVIYTTFWVTNYRPYYSSWYWNYYPSYYSYWNPFPIFRYRNHINVYIGGYGHVYNYVNYRNCRVAYNTYYGRRANAYEVRYPNRSFSHRNATVANRYELDRTRDVRTVNTRERGNTQPRIEASTRSNNSSRTEATTRSNNSTRSEAATRGESTTRDANTRATTRGSISTREENGATTPTRSNTSTRENSVSVESPRSSSATRSESSRSTTTSPRNNTSPRSESVRTNTSSPRATTSQRSETTSQRSTSSPKVSAPSRSSSPAKVSAPSRSSSSSNSGSRNSSTGGNSSRGNSSRGGRG